MRLCVTYPNRKLGYSETFIKRHLDYLKPALELTGGSIPYYDKDKGSIFTFPLKWNLLRGAIKNLFPNLYVIFFHKALKKKLISEKIDVVLAEYGTTGTNLAKTCFDINIPLIVHFHGFDAYFKKALKQYDQSYRQMFLLASKIVVVSEAMKKQINDLGCPSEKIISIPYGINTSIFKPDNLSTSEFFIISIGRFTSKKAPDLVIKAFEIVSNTVKNVRLKMIGDGELFDDTIRLIKKLGLSEKIELLGIKNQAEIIQELTKARIFVQHSLTAKNGDSEGMPNTILEAASSGLPIVSTFHAGIPEAVIHNETGYLVDEGDYKTMADYIIKLLQNPELARTMGKKGREHIDKLFMFKNQIELLKTTLNSFSNKEN